MFSYLVLPFPVLCLTATAVFGGRDDVVQDTISTLGLNQPILYLGRVRRDNIDFDIHSLDKQTDESRDEFKVNHVAQKIAEYVAEGKRHWSTARSVLRWTAFIRRYLSV